MIDGLCVSSANREVRLEKKHAVQRASMIQYRPETGESNVFNRLMAKTDLIAKMRSSVRRRVINLHALQLPLIMSGAFDQVSLIRPSRPEE